MTFTNLVFCIFPFFVRFLIIPFLIETLIFHITPVLWGWGCLPFVAPSFVAMFGLAQMMMPAGASGATSSGELIPPEVPSVPDLTQALHTSSDGSWRENSESLNALLDSSYEDEQSVSAQRQPMPPSPVSSVDQESIWLEVEHRQQDQGPAAPQENAPPAVQVPQFGPRARPLTHWEQKGIETRVSLEEEFTNVARDRLAET